PTPEAVVPQPIRVRVPDHVADPPPRRRVLGLTHRQCLQLPDRLPTPTRLERPTEPRILPGPIPLRQARSLHGQPPVVHGAQCMTSTARGGRLGHFSISARSGGSRRSQPPRPTGDPIYPLGSMAAGDRLDPPGPDRARRSPAAPAGSASRSNPTD